jgi:hypothetical protein
MVSRWRLGTLAMKEEGIVGQICDLQLVDLDHEAGRNTLIWGQVRAKAAHARGICI